MASLVGLSCSTVWYLVEPVREVSNLFEVGIGCFSLVFSSLCWWLFQRRLPNYLSAVANELELLAGKSSQQDQDRWDDVRESFQFVIRDARGLLRRTELRRDQELLDRLLREELPRYQHKLASSPSVATDETAMEVLLPTAQI